MRMSWKIISGALAIIGMLTSFGLIHELGTGVAHTRGGTILRSQNPSGFWFVVGIEALWVALLVFGAFRAWRQSQRELNL